jgi:hypothetical protein
MVSDPRNFQKVTYKFLPKHTLADRSLINHNGAFIPEQGIYTRSGSSGPIAGSTTGSVELSFDAAALKLRRVEVFHSGVATAFNLRIDNATPNSGSDFDPRNIVTCYQEIPGGTTFGDGIDQVEDLYALTDCSSGKEGKLYLKFMPYSTGNNWFKYLLFFEAVVLYHNRDGEFHR